MFVPTIYHKEQVDDYNKNDLDQLQSYTYKTLTKSALIFIANVKAIRCQWEIAKLRRCNRSRSPN